MAAQERLIQKALSMLVNSQNPMIQQALNFGQGYLSSYTPQETKPGFQTGQALSMLPPQTGIGVGDDVIRLALGMLASKPVKQVTGIIPKATKGLEGGVKPLAEEARGIPLYHYSDTKIQGGVLKPSTPHPQNYLGDAVYVTNQKAGYPGKYEYQAQLPKDLKILDLTGGKEGSVGMNFAKKVADKLGIPYEPQGQGLYDDLRWMEQQLSPNKMNNTIVQAKIRKVVDEMTKGYDAIKAPWYDAIDGSTKNWELVIRNREVPLSGLEKGVKRGTKKVNEAYDKLLKEINGR